MSLPPVVSTPNAPGWSRWIERLRAATGGRFTIVRELGRGGFAAVFLAQQLQPNRRVAIKLLLPTHLDSQWALEHFRGESQKISEWRHQSVVTIYEVHEVEELFFFVMSYVEGGSLHDLIQQLGPLPIPVVRSVLAQIGSALQYAHRQGVTHRDIKPQNVLIDTDGGAVVTDFGISKQAGGESHTVTGMIFGSPPYMAPEQCSTGKTSTASDQYALGIVAYEMLTGKPPFSGAPMQVLISHMQDPVPPLHNARPDCPPELEAAVARMLSKEPDDRFPSVSEAMHAAGAIELPEYNADRRAFAAAAREAADRAHMPVLELLSIPPSIEVGERIPIEARAKTLTGEVIPETSIEWSVDNETVGRLDAAGGTLTGLEPGEITLVAKTRGTQQQIRVTVIPPKVARLDVAAPEGPIRIGTETMLLATARSKSGLRVPAVTLWSSADPALAVVAPDGTLRTIKPGRALIRAQVEDVVTEFWIDVVPPTVSEVRVTGSQGPLTIGDRRQLSALVLDATDQVLAEHPVQWSASDRRVATVSPTGLVIGIAAGTITVTAKADGHSSDLTFAVQEPRAAHVEVQKPGGVVNLGDRTRLRAIVKDERGNSVDRSVTWVSNNPAVARVEPDGTVTTIGPGQVNITATIDGVTAMMALSIAEQELPMVTSAQVFPTPEKLTSTAPRKAAAKPATFPHAAAPVPATTSEPVKVAAPRATTKSGGSTRVIVGVVGALIIVVGGYFALKGRAGNVGTAAQTATNSGTSAQAPQTPPANNTPPTTSTPSQTAPSGPTGETRSRPTLSLGIAAPATIVAVGDSVRLDAVASDGSTPDTVRWSSTSTRRATVSANGVVHGVSEGQAVIVARSGKMIDSIRMNVRPRSAVVTSAPTTPPPVVAATPPPVVTPPRDTVIPPVRQVEPPPTRTETPPAPSPAAIADRQARQLVVDYAAALTTRNVDNVSRIFPTMAPAARSGWRGFFGTVRDFQATYRVDNVAVSGTTATVRASGDHRYTYQTGKQCTVPVSFDFRMSESGGTWRVTSVDQVGRTTTC